MKLLFVGDGNSVHTQRWVNWFARRHEVAFIGPGDGGELSSHLVASLPGARRLPGARIIAATGLVRRVADSLRPDVLHAHYINEFGWLAAGSRRRPLVISAWGSDIYRAPDESRLARTLNPLAVRAADLVTCDSVDQARALEAWGVATARIAVVGWGVDRRSFHPAVDGAPMRTRLGLPGHARVILSPRRWHPNSNLPTIVAAHARLPEDTYLVLKQAPGSRDEPSVDDAVGESTARERIVVVPPGPEHELAELYAASDVVVSLCSTDGTPVSVLEAMAVGRPVVAFRNPSLEEWVQEPGGRLVDSLDPVKVGAALAAFLEDRELMRRAAVHNTEVIAERADRDREFARMESLYESVAGLRPRPGMS